ncbi:MAG: hypothetical protein ACOCYN_05340 [Planctomycetota bacterium]
MRCIATLILLLCWGGLHGVEEARQHWLHQDQRAPAVPAGPWQRLADGAVLPIAPGQELAGLAPGAYRSGPARIFVRAADHAGAYARAMVGLPTLRQEQLPEREQLAAAGLAVDHLTLVIRAWRMADGREWPWVAATDPPARGLPGLVDSVSGTSHGFRAAVGDVYRDAAERPVRIAAQGPEPRVQPGDLIAATAPGAEFSTIAVLVADRGEIGRLDPADLVVSAQAVGGALVERVRELRLGVLFGRQEIHLKRRSPARLERRTTAAEADESQGPLDGLTQWEQVCVLLGMLVIILTLLRRSRRYRLGQRRHERSRPGS